MELLELLKQLKNVQPDLHYSQRSRAEILLTPRTIRSKPFFGILKALEQATEYAFAIALTGVLLIIIVGAFSNIFRPLTPFGSLSSLNPAGLHAEAQAIDMQIQLTNLSYTETSSTVPGKTIAPLTTIQKLSQIKQKLQKPDEQISLESSSSKTEVSVDKALDQLSE